MFTPWQIEVRGRFRASSPPPLGFLVFSDLLHAFRSEFHFHHNVSSGDLLQQRNQLKPLGKIQLTWQLDNKQNVSQIILHWSSSKDSSPKRRMFDNEQSSYSIGSTFSLCLSLLKSHWSISEAFDEKHFYIFQVSLLATDGSQHQYQPLQMPIPGEPDAPKVWLVKNSDSSFVVEWSEPKSYGIALIGFEIYLQGEKIADRQRTDARRAEIRSKPDRLYQVNVRARTNNHRRALSSKSETLPVLTQPIADNRLELDDEDASPHSPVALHIDTINEEEIRIDWSSSSTPFAVYYLHYTCLNNQQRQTIPLTNQQQQQQQQQHTVSSKSEKQNCIFTLSLFKDCAPVETDFRLSSDDHRRRLWWKNSLEIGEKNGENASFTVKPHRQHSVRKISSLSLSLKEISHSQNQTELSFNNWQANEHATLNDEQKSRPPTENQCSANGADMFCRWAVVWEKRIFLSGITGLSCLSTVHIDSVGLLIKWTDSPPVSLSNHRRFHPQANLRSDEQFAQRSNERRRAMELDGEQHRQFVQRRELVRFSFASQRGTSFRWQGQGNICHLLAFICPPQSIRFKWLNRQKASRAAKIDFAAIN